MGQVFQDDIVAALQEESTDYNVSLSPVNTENNPVGYSSYLNIPNTPIDGGMISDASDELKHSPLPKMIQNRKPLITATLRKPITIFQRSEPRSVIQQNHQSVIIKNDGHCESETGHLTAPPVFRCPKCPKLYEDPTDFMNHLRIVHYDELHGARQRQQQHVPNGNMRNNSPNPHSSFHLHDGVIKNQIN